MLAIHTCAAGVIRAVVGADGALEAKRERDSSHRPCFEELKKRRNNDANGQKSDVCDAGFKIVRRIVT